MAVIDRFDYTGCVEFEMASGGFPLSIYVRMTDSATHLTKTGVSAVGDGSDIAVSKAGGAFATASAGGRAITELGTLGIYKYTFDAADVHSVNDNGQLAVKFTIAGTDSLIVVCTSLGRPVVGILAPNTITAASMNADASQEIATTLLATVMTELAQAAPDATPTVQKALMLLYMALRNASTATATERAVYNDAGTKVAKATLTDNGTTFTQGKLGSGA